MSHHSGIETINLADDAGAIRLILPLIERSRDIAAVVAAGRPFADPLDLADRIADAVNSLEEPSAVALFRRHPELAPPDPAEMTDASQTEQGRLGLNSNEAAKIDLARLNRLYSDKFGFPFILALHEHENISSVLTAFHERLGRERTAEIDENRKQICSVSRARVMRAFPATEEITQ
ncbi:2-oxo-4-hydroxy-4-carboxy-5-ureidoimidazoline decarboxylase [Amaricoccus macauensis]|uniref:2-oxo-4-hydroxy-4-carboxy-5-ureidoimidazoline decarboxylase n=1 Tax=Amaricoccus macauensis TaxID=57001 RepID=UPI003C7CDC76